MVFALQFVGMAFVLLYGFLFGAKLFLRSRGYDAAWLRTYGGDMAALRQIVAGSADTADRHIARAWLVAVRAAEALLVIGTIYLIGTASES